MTAFQYVCAASAVIIAAWPAIKSAAGVVPSLPCQSGKSGVSYQDAMENMAVVRSRLVKTDSLGEEQKKAIDVLTLALVSGSDK